MAAPTTTSPVAPAEPDLTSVIRVAVPQRGLRQDLRATGIVWRREWIRFRTDRLRAVTSLIQPILFLFVLGTGLGALAGRGLPPGVSFRTFIYPGVVAMVISFRPGNAGPWRGWRPRWWLRCHGWCGRCRT